MQEARSLRLRARRGFARPPVEIVVISVRSALERRRNIEATFQGTNLAWTFFDAHTSLQFPDLRYDTVEIQRTFGRTLSLPEIAVCSSHVAVLDAFVKRATTPYIFVLEDDVIYDTAFPLASFASFCSAHEIKYIRLFGKHYAKAVHLGHFYDRSIIRYRTSPAGGQAYMMSIEAAQRFLKSFRSITATIDIAVDEFWNTQLPIFSIFPYPIIERFSPTSIPIPHSQDRLTKPTDAVWRRNRLINKAKKIYGNLRLAGSDKRMRRKYLAFEQINPAEDSHPHM